MWPFHRTSPSTGLFGQCGAPRTNTWEWIARAHIAPKTGRRPHNGARASTQAPWQQIKKRDQKTAMLSLRKTFPGCRGNCHSQPNHTARHVSRKDDSYLSCRTFNSKMIWYQIWSTGAHKRLRSLSRAAVKHTDGKTTSHNPLNTFPSIMTGLGVSLKHR